MFGALKCIRRFFFSCIYTTDFLPYIIEPLRSSWKRRKARKCFSKIPFLRRKVVILTSTFYLFILLAKGWWDWTWPKPLSVFLSRRIESRFNLSPIRVLGHKLEPGFNPFGLSNSGKLVLSFSGSSLQNLTCMILSTCKLLVVPTIKCIGPNVW